VPQEEIPETSEEKVEVAKSAAQEVEEDKEEEVSNRAHRDDLMPTGLQNTAPQVEHHEVDLDNIYGNTGAKQGFEKGDTDEPAHKEEEKRAPSRRSSPAKSASKRSSPAKRSSP
jgi:hypothetical protein